MSLLYDNIVNEDEGNDAIAFRDSSLYTFISPNGAYAAGNSRCLWSANLISAALIDKTDVSGVWVVAPSGVGVGLSYQGMVALCIDDEGTLWGLDVGRNLNGLLYRTEADDLAGLGVAASWTASVGDTRGLTASVIFAFTMPDASIKVVILPERGSDAQTPYVHTHVKDEAAIASTATPGGFWPTWAFQDDNGDIWVIGNPKAGGVGTDEVHLWRITDATGSSPYDDSFIAAVPEIDGSGADPLIIGSPSPYAHCLEGAAVGILNSASVVRGAGGNDQAASYTFSIPLDGITAVTTTEIPADEWWSYNFGNPLPADEPYMWLYQMDADGPLLDGDGYIDHRTIGAFEPDFTSAATYDLNDWGISPDKAKNPTYVGTLGSYGAFVANWPNLDNSYRGDLNIYYLADSPADVGGDSGDPTLRVWGFSLDGHDFYVLRVGDSETLVYDLTTGRWTPWASPGRNNWRAHVGQNWVGMSADTLDRGFGTDIVAGDDTTGVLWVLDPATGRDDNTDTGNAAFTRTVTGAVALSGRETVRCNAVQITLSLGSPAMTGAQIWLRTSDDMGQNWLSYDAITIAAGSFSQVVELRSLGLIRQPGRIFEINDNGAAVRISGADMR